MDIVVYLPDDLAIRAEDAELNLSRILRAGVLRELDVPTEKLPVIRKNIFGFKIRRGGKYYNLSLGILDSARDDLDYVLIGFASSESDKKQVVRVQRMFNVGLTDSFEVINPDFLIPQSLGKRALEIFNEGSVSEAEAWTLANQEQST